MRRFSSFALINFVLFVLILSKYSAAGQSIITGDWTAETRDGKDDEIHLSFSRVSQHGKNQQSTNYKFSELEGLSRAQTQNGKVSFRLVREAGIIDCTGTFANGRGSGTFQFTANKTFVDGMRSRGFDFEKQSKEHDGDSVLDRLFAATTLNVTTALADDLLSANFGKLDVDDLFKGAIFKVDGKFMAEMKATGFPNLSFEDLVKARIFKVDAEYVRQVKEMGFTTDGFEGLIKFRIFKVTPEFLNEMRSAGFDKMSSEDIVKCRIFKIDAEFARQARAQEPDISIEDMVQMKIGVRRKN